MSIPLPDYFTPHVALVRDYGAGGGMGGGYGAAREVRGFSEDDQKVVVGNDGAEVTSSGQHHINFDEVVPLRSLVTIWPGLTGEREARVVAIKRGQHPDLPAFQTLYLE